MSNVTEMSLGFQPGVCSNNGAQVLPFQSPPKHTKLTPAGTAAETSDASLRLRFDSLTLDELSEELDRRTKETQRLQEEVENATKVTLERFGCTYGIHSSPGQCCHNHSFNVYDSSAVPSALRQAVTQPLVCDQESLNQEDISCCPGKETHDQPEHETFSVDEAIVNLQSELHKVRQEKDVLSDLRLKDSRTHVGQMEKMLLMLEELQNIKRTEEEQEEEEEQQETQDEALELNRKVETLEGNVKALFSSLLSHEKHCGHNAVTGPNVAGNSRQLRPAAENEETEEHQERLLLCSKKHLGSEEGSGVNQQNERMEDLITSLVQEVELLTDKLSSSKHDSDSLSVKLELLKKLAERQTSVHQCRVSELESTLCSHKDKVCCLEQQLAQAQARLLDAHSDTERRSQLTEELQVRLALLQRSAEQQQCEQQQELKALRGRLEETTCLQELLEQRNQEGRRSQELLQEQNQELQLRQQEAQHHLALLEEAQSRCQTLRLQLDDREKMADVLRLQLDDSEKMADVLRLQLDDREKMADVLRLQMESDIQQQRRTVHELHQENSVLSNQLNQHKLEIQQLRAESERLRSAAEQERLQLQASQAEHSQRLQEETLEKQQLSIQLEVQRVQFLSLSKEHEELRRLHSCRSEEQEGAALELRGRLRNAQDELDQVRSALRSLEGADGHGLQAALAMQEEITARRQQVDSLQAKIQHLEEIRDKLHQEKRHQRLEKERQLQELTVLREEKRQLGSELEALRSKDQQLRERIGRLEAILHKMSESFADCQDFIQLQEQDFFRLKLQHALDLKELQGQNLSVPPPDPDPPSPPAPAAPPSSQHASCITIRQQQSPAREQLRVISENRRPHTDTRRRSAPERVHRTTFPDGACDVKTGSRLRSRTCSSDTHFLKELNGKINNNKPFSHSRVTWSPAAAGTYALLSPGRRSPVHSLLTSDPTS